MAMARPTPPQDAFTRYSVLEYLLIGDLRDLLDESPDAETRRWLLAVLDELLDLLPNEFEFEDQEGYMSDVCDQVPNWSHEVDQLHNQHEDLYFKLLELRNRITLEQAFEYIASEMKSELQHWIERVQRHRDHEQRLVAAAYDLTLGGEA